MTLLLPTLVMLQVLECWWNSRDAKKSPAADFFAEMRSSPEVRREFLAVRCRFAYRILRSVAEFRRVKQKVSTRLHQSGAGYRPYLADG